MIDSRHGSIKTRWHSYKEGHFLNLHGVVKGSAGAGTALMVELSEDNGVLQGLDKNLDNLEYQVMDITVRSSFGPGTEIPDEPLTA